LAKKSNGAWANQSASLVEVQRYGSNLERTVRDTLDWDAGRVLYDLERGYNIQIDCAYPSLNKPQAIASVTYSNPDTPGHSNENKLQLKLGELALLKNAYPDLRAVLVLGGTGEAWLKYVIAAFKFFYDDIIYLWDKEDADRLAKLARDPTRIPSRHQAFWQSLRLGWKRQTLSPPGTRPPVGLVRYDILDALIASINAKKPDQIENEIARHCMEASVNSGGTEWEHFVSRRWHAIEMSRSFFNPVEAATHLSLVHGGFHFEGGLAKDVEVASLLHQLGMRRTKLSEDFILYSKKLKKRVYIQCKASGGGRSQHGKNIQNRTKEQVARGILYTAQISANEELIWKDKDFHWIGIVDGDWGVTQREPLKYIHMLQLAGYDQLFCAAELLNSDLSLKKANNPLVEYLRSLDCR
jgi:hypothetical protein